MFYSFFRVASTTTSQPEGLPAQYVSNIQSAAHISVFVDSFGHLHSMYPVYHSHITYLCLLTHLATCTFLSTTHISTGANGADIIPPYSILSSFRGV